MWKSDESGDGGNYQGQSGGGSFFMWFGDSDKDRVSGGDEVDTDYNKNKKMKRKKKKRGWLTKVEGNYILLAHDWNPNCNNNYNNKNK